MTQSKFLYAQHLHSTVSEVKTYRYRLELGLSKNEVAEIRSFSYDAFAAVVANQSWAIVLHTDPDVPDIGASVDETGTLFVSSFANNSREENISKKHDWQNVPFEVPGDLCFLHTLAQAGQVNFHLGVYFTKKKVNSLYIANLLAMYGMAENVRENIEETGAKSPYSDV